MGKYDKDRRQKELAVRYCLAREIVPCLEVIVPSSADLSDSVETLTDIDVLGLEFTSDGGFRRTIFDCKTGRMSPINRAFWAAGVLKYTGCDDAVVILRDKAVNNHRLSSLKIGVDLHDEQSFIDLGRTFDLAFDKDNSYQASLDRWNGLYDCYTRNEWTEGLYSVGRNVVPLSSQPSSSFRKLVAELRQIRGYVDPNKDAHVAVYLDVLGSIFSLWSALGKDIRRFYQPTMSKEDFEKILRYYVWGGKETYVMRQELLPRMEDGSVRLLEMPAWDKLVSFSGIVISAPQELSGCVNICRNLSIRTACGIDVGHDAEVGLSMKRYKRARQFILSASDYLIAACSLPRDLGTRLESVLAAFTRAA